MIAKMKLNVNGEVRTVQSAPDVPLLWVLRDELGLLGTKYGCGLGICGSCTVDVAGTATRSCVTRVAEIGDAAITTIEGLATDGGLHPVQRAWIEEEVAQCGFCQAGQIMSVVTLLRETPRPSDRQIDDAMRDVICRCGTYERIRRAIHRVSRGEPR